jgi:hypothetical protein
MRKLSTNIFYVYEHWRLDQDVCFYVGKGKGKRAWDLSCRDGTNSRNRWHKFLIQKLHPRGLLEVRLVFEQLEESHAFQLERERISHWRSNGIRLVNLTDGGAGSAGVFVKAETRHKNSVARKGKKLSLEHRANIAKGKIGNKNALGYKRKPHEIAAIIAFNKNRPPPSAETREKMRVAKLGRKLSEDHKAKIKASVTQAYKSEEVRKKCANSPEVIERVRILNTGRKQTHEHIAKKVAAAIGKKYRTKKVRESEMRS